jgi:hypothetical protein
MLSRDDVAAAFMLVGINLQISIALFLLCDKTRLQARYNRAIKRNKDGTIRKRRSSNFDRKRGIVDRQKLQLMPDKHFSDGIRMPRWLFEQLLVKVTAVFDRQIRRRKRAKKYSTHTRDVDPYIALAFTLAFLAGARQWDMAYMFNLGMSTVKQWTWRTIDAINKVLGDNILFPTSRAGLDALAQGFRNIAGGMGGALQWTVCAFDGVCVQKMCPPAKTFKPGQPVDSNCAAHYFRKGYFGAAVLAFVDSKCRFLSFSMACAASCHDSTMFECSSAGTLLANGLIDPKYNAVGDDAFTNRGHVITPYSGNTLTPQEDSFNYYVSLQRQVVERAFAIWKRKWGIYWRRLQVSQRNIKRVIEVTCRLHNLCIDRNVSHDLDDFLVHDDLYWEKVRPAPLNHPRVSMCVDNPNPVMLDVRTRAAMLPVEFSGIGAETMRRKHLCDLVAAQGLTRPVPISLDMQFPREDCALPNIPAHQPRIRKRGHSTQ